MNKGKKLLILLVVVLVLGGGYFAASHFLKDDGEAETAAADTVAVEAMTEKDIAAIAYQNGSETLRFVKDGDVWKLDSDRAFPLKQSLVQTMASDAAGLTALRLVSEKPEDFAEYGLSEPDTAYVFTLTDGSEVTYYIGNYNSFGSTYYMNVAGTNQIYLIDGSFLDNFDHDLSDLCDVEDLPSVPAEDIRGIDMTLDGKSTRLYRQEKGSKSVYSDVFTWFFDEKTPSDAIASQSLVSTAIGFSGDGVAAYRSDDETRKHFSLDEPDLKIRFDYTTSTEEDTGKTDENDEPITKTVTKNESLTLMVGKASGDGRLYAMTDRSDVVYLIAPEYLQGLRDFDYDSLRPAEVCAVQTSDIQSMDVTIGGKTSKIVLTRSETSSGGQSILYTLDGKQISPTKFNDFYSAIQSMQAEGFAEDESARKDSALTVVYHTSRKGFETMTLQLFPYDGSFYVSSLNDDFGRLVNKRSVEKALDSFKSLGEQ